MPQLARVPKPGVRKQIPLKLQPDIALDLHAFCEAHYNAPQNEIISRAVRRFIDSELESDKAARRRFAEARERILAEQKQSPGTAAEPIRLVPNLSRKGKDEARVASE
jgi:hypothetical protein